MISRSVAIGIGILVLVGLGLLFMSTMTGNVITGSAAVDEVVENEYYRISDFGNKVNEEVIGNGEDSSGSE